MICVFLTSGTCQWYECSSSCVSLHKQCCILLITFFCLRNKLGYTSQNSVFISLVGEKTGYYKSKRTGSASMLQRTRRIETTQEDLMKNLLLVARARIAVAGFIIDDTNSYTEFFADFKSKSRKWQICLL